MRTTVLRSLLLAAVVGVGVPPPASAAPRATVVPCGAVLTTSVRLAADITCPDGRGITLAADGIELNLNGHRLIGPGTGTYGPIGIDIDARDVVVRNGRISAWSTAVSAGPEIDSPVERRVRSATLRSVRLDGNRTGADARVDGRLVVQSSRLDGNLRGGSAYVDGALTVANSTVERNGTGLHGFANDDGEFVVRDSVVRCNGVGLSCSQDADITVRGTTVQRNGTGLDVDQCSGFVDRSTFVWNTRHVQAWLVDSDVLELSCTSFTRDGGPVGFPVEPC